MAFKFRLQGILRLREMEEKEAKIELGRLRQEEHRLEENIREILGQRSDWADRYNARGREENPESDMLIIEKFLIGLEGTQRHLEATLGQMRQRINLQIAVVEKAYKAKRQIEKLREKQKEEYEFELKAKESREIQDLTMLRRLFKEIERAQAEGMNNE